MEQMERNVLEQLVSGAVSKVYHLMVQRVQNGEPLGSVLDNDGREFEYTLERANSSDGLTGQVPNVMVPHPRGRYHPNPLVPHPAGDAMQYVQDSSGNNHRASQASHDNFLNPHDPHMAPVMRSIESTYQPALPSTNPVGSVSISRSASASASGSLSGFGSGTAYGSVSSETSSPVTPNHNVMRAFRNAESTNTSMPPASTAPSEMASRLKRSYTEYRGRTPSGRRLQGENDPENREIMRLRQEENLEFDEIARILNKKRIKSGGPTNLTANAIYSRYKRNGPLIAAAEGKEFVPAPRDQRANGQGIKFKKVTVIKGFDDYEDELLVKAVSDIEGKKWELVAARLEELGGKKHNPEMCAHRFHAL